MKGFDEALFLHLIHRNGDLGTLVSAGYDFGELAEALIKARSEGKIAEVNGRLILKELGICVLNSSRTKNKVFILPDIANQIPKLRSDEIFVPERGRINLEP